VAITPDGTRAYVANFSPKTVSAIDTSSNTVVATVTGVGAGPAGVAITPDGALAYVVNQDDNAVSVIATSGNTVVATLGVGTSPIGVAITPAPSPLAQIDQLIAAVQALFNAGTLNRGQENALRGPLERAEKFLDQGRAKQTINQMQGFIANVNGLVSGGVLTRAQGQPMINRANAVIHTLGE
jgi:YVTN family beta-propeller protein